MSAPDHLAEKSTSSLRGRGRPHMVLVAEGRDSQIDARPALFAWLGLRVFDRPARVAVLLAQLGGVIRPLRRDKAFFDVALFAVGYCAVSARRQSRLR